MHNNIEKTASNCPKDGNCKLSVLKNKSLQIKKDAFGATYPEINESGNILLEYEYKKDDIPETADSSYKELIYVELNPNHLEVNYSDGDLKKASVTFARLCFCRGLTGYYNVSSGSLKIKKKDSSSYLLELSFKISEVPQIISYISEDFTL